MTVEAILSLATMLITFIFGKLAKKFSWIESNYIPLQNLLIGVFGGCMVYAVGLHDNIVTSIILCTLSAFGAGGIYDLSKTKEEIK